jgi:hypothetical protein
MARVPRILFRPFFKSEKSAVNNSPWNLASVPLADPEMTEEEEMAEVERREKEIETGQVRVLTDAEFWRKVEADLRKCA